MTTPGSSCPDLFCHGEIVFISIFCPVVRFVYWGLGWEEESATFGAGPWAIRSRLAAVELELATCDAGSLQRLPPSQILVTTEFPASRTGLITLEWKQGGNPIAGNGHDGQEEAGAGNQLTVWQGRHS